MQDAKATLEWYNSHAQEYATKIASLTNDELLGKFTAAVKNGGKVLDAGCAAGRDSRILQDSGLEVTGIDLSSELIRIARQNNPDISFVEGSFLDLPFQAETFDGVWAHASLLHLESIEQVQQALQEFHRVLSTDGILHIMVKQQKGTEKTSVVSDALSGHLRFFRWFVKDEIELLVTEAGFQLITLQDELPDPANRGEVSWVYALAKKTQ